MTPSEVVRALHFALEHRELDVVAEYLHPAVTWTSLEENLACTDRDEVLETMKGFLDAVPPVDDLELEEHGDQVMVGLPALPDWEEPYFWQRILVHDDQMVRIEDRGTREAAKAPIAG